MQVPELQYDRGEIHNLSEDDQLQLMKESCLLAACLEDTFRPDKLNVAALGNMVSQLHVHHVVRFRSDAAWPKPISISSGVPARRPVAASSRRATTARPEPAAKRASCGSWSTTS